LTKGIKHLKKKGKKPNPTDQAVYNAIVIREHAMKELKKEKKN
jgi:hypothetical protein